jgi:hypothetical protein
VRISTGSLSFIILTDGFYSLLEDYKFHAKRLRVTGGGIDADDDSQRLASNNPVECMDFYIPASGPEASTPEFAVNLWRKLLIVHIRSHVLTRV